MVHNLHIHSFASYEQNSHIQQSRTFKHLNPVYDQINRIPAQGIVRNKQIAA